MPLTMLMGPVNNGLEDIVKFLIFRTTKMSRVVRKPPFCICENKDADQLRGNPEADQRLCFCAIRIVQSLYYLHLKFQASSHLLWLYRPVCVGPSRKPRRPVFSERGSNNSCNHSKSQTMGSSCREICLGGKDAKSQKFHENVKNQRTIGPVNAHLISWPSKAQNIQNLENIC